MPKYSCISLIKPSLTYFVDALSGGCSTLVREAGYQPGGPGLKSLQMLPTFLLILFLTFLRFNTVPLNEVLLLF